MGVIAALTREPLPKVVATLTDERWVDPSHPDSNEGTVRHSLGSNDHIQLKGLKTAHDTPEEAIEDVSELIAELDRPISAVLLGIGEDGHFASIFPGRPELDATGSCVAVTGLVGHHPRLSLTLETLLDSKEIFIFAASASKQKVLLEPGNRPIARVLEQVGVPVNLYFCEDA